MAAALVQDTQCVACGLARCTEAYDHYSVNITELEQLIDQHRIKS